MSHATKAVFLSYASQDVAAALRICESLRSAGIEVWFDQDALVGGDAWDAKIRGQIGACALFIPVRRLLALGRDDAARRLAAEISARTAKELERGTRAKGSLLLFIRAEIVLGHHDAAVAALEQWRRENQLVQNNYHRQRTEAQHAPLYALLGKADEAVAVLREYTASGLQLNYSLRYDPEFALIRSEPRFQELMRQQEAWAKAQPDPVDL